MLQSPDACTNRLEKNSFGAFLCSGYMYTACVVVTRVSLKGVLVQCMFDNTLGPKYHTCKVWSRDLVQP